MDSLVLYYTEDFPPEYSVPCDYLLRARAVCSGRHHAQICNLARDRISFARQTSAQLFDGAKLERSGVEVHRSNFGGAAMYCGAEDLTYSFHINREALDDPDEPARDIYRRVTRWVCDAIRDLGIEADIRTEGAKNTRDGVCVSLEGRSEIVAPDGTKLVGSVYKDDGLIHSTHGLILVTDAWADIYDFMKVAPPRARAGSLQDFDPGLDFRLVSYSILMQLGDPERAQYTERDYRTMRRLVPQFEYGRWQA